MPDTIQAGDIVNLKDGLGIEMVVESVNSGIARCVFWDSKEGGYIHDNINVAALEKVEK